MQESKANNRMACKSFPHPSPETSIQSGFPSKLGKAVYNPTVIK